MNWTCPHCDQHGDLECPEHPDCACGCQAHAHWQSEPYDCIAGRVGCGCKRYRPHGFSVHARRLLMWRDDFGSSVFDPAERAREKQASRDADAQALADGTKTREQLRRENAAFAFPRDRVRLTPPKRER